MSSLVYGFYSSSVHYFFNSIFAFSLYSSSLLHGQTSNLLSQHCVSCCTTVVANSKSRVRRPKESRVCWSISSNPSNLPFEPPLSKSCLVSYVGWCILSSRSNNKSKSRPSRLQWRLRHPLTQSNSLQQRKRRTTLRQRKLCLPQQSSSLPTKCESPFPRIGSTSWRSSWRWLANHDPRCV